MAITAISSVSVTNNRNNVIQFGARKNKDVNEENIQDKGSKSHKAGGMVTIPTALFLALASSSFNAQAQNQFNFDYDNSEKIELLAMNNPQPVSRVSSSQQTRRGDLPDIMTVTGSKNIYQKDFMMDGKKWTMYYHNASSTRNPANMVTQIYFIPADFRIVKDRYNFEVNCPPEMEAFIVHESTNEKETFGAAKIIEVTCNKDGSNRKRVIRELKLPDEISDELVNLYLGRGNFRLDEDLQEEFSIVNTPKLMTPKVTSFER